MARSRAYWPGLCLQHVLSIAVRVGRRSVPTSVAIRPGAPGAPRLYWPRGPVALSRAYWPGPSYRIARALHSRARGASFRPHVSGHSARGPGGPASVLAPGPARSGRASNYSTVLSLAVHPIPPEPSRRRSPVDALLSRRGFPVDVLSIAPVLYCRHTGRVSALLHSSMPCVRCSSRAFVSSTLWSCFRALAFFHARCSSRASLSPFVPLVSSMAFVSARFPFPFPSSQMPDGALHRSGRSFVLLPSSRLAFVSLASCASLSPFVLLCLFYRCLAPGPGGPVPRLLPGTIILARALLGRACGLASPRPWPLGLWPRGPRGCTGPGARRFGPASATRDHYDITCSS